MAMDTQVAVVGLGYVGLPVALAFGARLPTVGFDVSAEKIAAYREGRDPTNEAPPEDFVAAKQMVFTDDPAAIAQADYVVVAVPTPIDGANRPDMGALRAASRTVGQNLKRGAVVIYESTVYPGATEEVCAPILEQESGYRWREDFFLGYSPERINPGDREHTLSKIVKVVSGDSEETCAKVAALYEAIIEAGVHCASSIKVAEAAKVIENTQRDLNIALMNELSLIFNRMDIDTKEVLAAAGTKWNFLRFHPGLVGGHCIGVDPYYLTHKAEELGYHPEVILAGRRINDTMGKFVAQETIKRIMRNGNGLQQAAVTVLGVTFKPNVPDVRNSKVLDVVQELRDFGLAVTLHDPVADGEEVRSMFGAISCPWEALPQSDALIVGAPHTVLMERPAEEICTKLKPGGLCVDVMGGMSPEPFRNSGYGYWRL